MSQSRGSVRPSSLQIQKNFMYYVCDLLRKGPATFTTLTPDHFNLVTLLPLFHPL